MDRYERFEVEDFVIDDFFIQWVLNPGEMHDVFWQEWLSEHPDRAEVVYTAREIIRALRVHPVNQKFSGEEIRSIHQKIVRGNSSYPSLHHFLSSGWFKAASVLIVMTIGLFVYNRFLPQRNIKNGLLIKEFRNSSNINNLIRLPDGSLAVLKPNSRLRYPQTFHGKERVVLLEGEAFFEVKKNSHKPFLVRSQNMITEVVGTSFTVRAFKNAEEFKVIVNTGKVKVFDQLASDAKSSKRILVLRPKQQAIFKRSSLVLRKDTVLTPLMLAKEEAKEEFTFQKATFSVVIDKLEKAYGVPINYDKARFRDLVITTSLADLPLDKKIAVICKATNAACEFSNGQVYIKALFPKNSNTNPLTN